FAHQILGQPIALLDLTLQLIAATVDLGKVIIGQLTPLLLDLAFHFLPVPFDSVPVHLSSPKSVISKVCHFQSLSFPKNDPLPKTANVTTMNRVPRTVPKTSRQSLRNLAERDWSPPRCTQEHMA